MRWSFQIATLFGIPIRVHGTFLLLLAFIGMLPPDSEGIVPAGVAGMVLVGLVFACVLSHELGHSLVARAFGVQVDSITLLPIGGMAAMRTLPRSARAEMLIAMAGPAVSVALAVVLGAVAYVAYGGDALGMIGGRGLKTPLVVQLATINIVLAVFNLLPAFPMDGGRILRAGLWSRLGFTRATTVAANVGQGLAVALFIIAITNWNLWLGIIALFIYSGAEAEARAAKLHAAVVATGGVSAADVMTDSVECVGQDETIEHVQQRMTQTSQDSFPVFHDGALVGILARSEILRAIREHEADRPVGQFMTRQVVFCSPADSLACVVQAMRKRDLSCIAVIGEGRLLGLITRDQLDRVGVV